jgi:uncharacterized protein (TIGR02271 family)
MSKTITAFFESYDDAADAVRRLEAGGIAHRDISIVANNEGERYSSHAKRTFDGTNHDHDTHADDGAGTGATVGTLAGGGAGALAGLGMLAIPGLGPVVAAGWLVSTLVGAGAGAALGGLAGSLVGAGVPEDDANAYAEGVRRGGALVTVRASDADVDRVVSVLDDDGKVNVKDGQTPMRTGSSTGSATSSMASGTAAGLTGSTGRTGTAGMPATGLGATAPGKAGDKSFGAADRTGRDQVIPIAEEKLHVGKREVEQGRVRVHSRIVETPVQEQVTLRDETVSVDRRPVSGEYRAGSLDGKDVFRERTIEVEERDEEAVISKEARVKEELVIHKDVENRTKTVSDTVRRTEVDVDDDRTASERGSGTSGIPPRRP